MIPTKEEAQDLLNKNVTDEYQLHHAQMVAVCMEGYGKMYGENALLWYVTGLLHDIDFEKYPNTHPGESLKWFEEWDYPNELIHAVEAHAYGFNGYSTEPKTKLAAALMACDEICGIFYAYQKLNPIPYGEMKESSILKRIKEKGFAPGIDRDSIRRGCEALGVTLEDHVSNLKRFLA